MRKLEILLFLMKNNKVTIENLANMFNVSKRTIQRDLDKLSILGIPIISQQGRHGGVLLDKHYMLSNTMLTKSEYNSMITSLYISENIIETIISDQVLNKLFLINSHKLTKSIDDLVKYLVVDLFEKKINISEVINKSINNALENKNIIKVYLEKKSYKVKPISYILKCNGLYLYVHYENEYALIKIDAIDAIDILEEKYDIDFIPYIDNKNITILNKKN